MNVLPPPVLSERPSHADEGKRIEYVDLAKGICMLIVIVQHAVSFYDVCMPLENFITTFWMSLFFMLSGLFFKPSDNFGIFMVHKVNRLLVPFFFFYFVVSVLVANALTWMGFDFVRNVDSLGWRSLYAFITIERFPNGPIWFLLCLFWVNVFFYFIHTVAVRVFRDERWQVACVVVLSLCCAALGYACSVFGVNLWAFIDSALSVMPFYGVGFVLFRHTSVLRPNKWDRWLPLWVVGLLTLTWVFQGGIDHQLNVYWPDTPFYAVLIGGIAGSLAILLLSKMIGRRVPVLSFWGRYTIIILCTQMPFNQLVSRIWGKVGLIDAIGIWPSVLVHMVVFVIAYELIIPLCVRLIPWFVAQKDLIPVSK